MADEGSPGVVSLGNSCLFGLVAISAAAPVLHPVAALALGVIGAAAHVLCLKGLDYIRLDDPVGSGLDYIRLDDPGLDYIRLDDPVGSVAVHAGGGLVGLLGAGVLSPVASRANLLAAQLVGALLIMAWCALTACVTCACLDLAVGIRCSYECETDTLATQELNLVAPSQLPYPDEEDSADELNKINGFVGYLQKKDQVEKVHFLIAVRYYKRQVSNVIFRSRTKVQPAASSISGPALALNNPLAAPSSQGSASYYRTSERQEMFYSAGSMEADRDYLLSLARRLKDTYLDSYNWNLSPSLRRQLDTHLRRLAKSKSVDIHLAVVFDPLALLVEEQLQGPWHSYITMYQEYLESSRDSRLYPKSQSLLRSHDWFRQLAHKQCRQFCITLKHGLCRTCKGDAETALSGSTDSKDDKKQYTYVVDHTTFQVIWSMKTESRESEAGGVSSAPVTGWDTNHQAKPSQVSSWEGASVQANRLKRQTPVGTPHESAARAAEAAEVNAAARSPQPAAVKRQRSPAATEGGPSGVPARRRGWKCNFCCLDGCAESSASRMQQQRQQRQEQQQQQQQEKEKEKEDQGVARLDEDDAPRLDSSDADLHEEDVAIMHSANDASERSVVRIDTKPVNWSEKSALFTENVSQWVPRHGTWEEAEHDDPRCINQVNNSIRSINLRANDIGDEGAKAIGLALQEGKGVDSAGVAAADFCNDHELHDNNKDDDDSTLEMPDTVIQIHFPKASPPAVNKVAESQPQELSRAAPKEQALPLQLSQSPTRPASPALHGQQQQPAAAFAEIMSPSLTSPLPQAQQQEGRLACQPSPLGQPDQPAQAPREALLLLQPTLTSTSASPSQQSLLQTATPASAAAITTPQQPPPPLPPQEHSQTDLAQLAEGEEELKGRLLPPPPPPLQQQTPETETHHLHAGITKAVGLDGYAGLPDKAARTDQAAAQQQQLAMQQQQEQQKQLAITMDNVPFAQSVQLSPRLSLHAAAVQPAGEGQANEHRERTVSDASKTTSKASTEELSSSLAHDSLTGVPYTPPASLMRRDLVGSSPRLDQFSEPESFQEGLLIWGDNRPDHRASFCEIKSVHGTTDGWHYAEHPMVEYDGKGREVKNQPPRLPYMSTPHLLVAADVGSDNSREHRLPRSRSEERIDRQYRIAARQSERRAAAKSKAGPCGQSEQFKKADDGKSNSDNSSWASSFFPFLRRSNSVPNVPALSSLPHYITQPSKSTKRRRARSPPGPSSHRVSYEEGQSLSVADDLFSATPSKTSSAASPASADLPQVQNSS
eukprot:g48926.t1